MTPPHDVTADPAGKGDGEEVDRYATWFACEQPERPPDAFVVWHYGGCVGCVGCSFKATVQRARFPDNPHVAWLVSQTGEGAHP